MPAKAAASSSAEIQILEVSEGVIDVCILGRTPLVLNRLSEKAKHELLMPAGRKTAADKASRLKHEPLQEYRDSPYKSSDPNGPTLIMMPATAFKGAMGTAALDIPGAKKSQIGRLVYVDGDVRHEYVSIYGKPELMMAITRSADVNKTPDVRTRAVIRNWACVVTVKFAKPALREQSIANLLAAAGRFSGVGDWRTEKGSGNFGSFELVDADDARFKQVLKIGRLEQLAAMESPECYDEETADLLKWFDGEIVRRGHKVAA